MDFVRLLFTGNDLLLDRFCLSLNYSFIYKSLPVRWSVSENKINLGSQLSIFLFRLALSFQIIYETTRASFIFYEIYSGNKHSVMFAGVNALRFAIFQIALWCQLGAAADIKLFQNFLNAVISQRRAATEQMVNNTEDQGVLFMPNKTRIDRLWIVFYTIYGAPTLCVLMLFFVEPQTHPLQWTHFENDYLAYTIVCFETWTAINAGNVLVVFVLFTFLFFLSSNFWSTELKHPAKDIIKVRRLGVLCNCWNDIMANCVVLPVLLGDHFILVFAPFLLIRYYNSMNIFELMLASISSETTLAWTLVVLHLTADYYTKSWDMLERLTSKDSSGYLRRVYRSAKPHRIYFGGFFYLTKSTVSGFFAITIDNLITLLLA